MSMEVAKTILSQLGGNKFIAMTGSKGFTGDDTSLTFRVGRNTGKWHAVKITLTPMDTYTITFYQFYKHSISKIKDVQGVCCDNLTDIFTSVTGLEVSL